MIHRQNSPTLPVGDLTIYACTAFGIAVLLRGLLALMQIPIPADLSHTVWLACVLAGLMLGGGLLGRMLGRRSAAGSDSDHRTTHTPRSGSMDLGHRHAR